MQSFKSIDAYITSHPKPAQVLLRRLRAVIKKAAPQAMEAMKYGIPTFVFKRNLVHFGAYETHIGFYPGSAAIVAFRKELSKYDGAKGTVRFPIGEPLPLALIARIVKYRVAAELRREKGKSVLKICSRGHEYRGSGPCPKCWPGHRS